MTEMPECLFCRIVAGAIPARIIEREPGYLAFADTNPQAPTHVLVAPTRHIPCVSAHDGVREVGELFAVAARLGKRLGYGAGHGPGGFRLVVNEGTDGGQTVGHLHVHVLAGRRFAWPPG
jgi:histidine triad (HIT) family protein